MTGMDTVTVDPIDALFAAGDGRFEWVRGSLEPMQPTSDEHDDEMTFLVSVMRSYAEEGDAGRVKADQFAERLDAEGMIPSIHDLSRES